MYFGGLYKVKDFTFGQGAFWISKNIVFIFFFLQIFIYLYFSFHFIHLPNAKEDISKEG
jgi:hypothetical protein